jgi:hypothetical protein
LSLEDPGGTFGHVTSHSAERDGIVLALGDLVVDLADALGLLGRSMAGGVKAGGSMVCLTFAVTNPSWVAQDPKEDRLAWMLAMDLGATLNVPLGVAPSGLDREPSWSQAKQVTCLSRVRDARGGSSSKKP